MPKLLPKEQDLRTSTLQRLRSKYLIGSTMLALPLSLGRGRWWRAGKIFAQAFYLVGVVTAVAAVAPGQGLLQAPGCSRPAAAQHQYPGHNAARGLLHGQPALESALAPVYKRLHSIAFESFGLLSLGLFRAQPGQGWRGLHRSFLSIWQCSCARRPWRAQCCVASCARPAAAPPARTAPLWPRPPAQSAPGSRTLCIDIWRAHPASRCAGCAHCHSGRRNVA